MTSAARRIVPTVVLAILAMVAPADAGAAPLGNAYEYVICVATVDHHELRYDSTHSTAADARSRQAAILADGWTYTDYESRGEDTYPAHAVVKVRFVDMQLDGEGEGCPAWGIKTRASARVDR